MKILENLKKILKLSQSDLAKECNFSNYTISKMERGKYDFRITEIEKISLGLKIHLHEVFKS